MWDEVPQPRVSENKSGIIQQLINKVVAGGGTDLGEGKVLVNLEGFKPGEAEVYLGQSSPEGKTQLPLVSVSDAQLQYVPPVFEVEGRLIPESGVIPVYGQEPVLLRKHPEEGWSVHWPYEGQMCWLPLSRVPLGTMRMIETHLQDAALYPREAHEWALLCLHDPQAVQATIPRPEPEQVPLTWTQKRKLAAGKRPGRGHR